MSKETVMFWLDTIAFANNRGFAPHELNRIEQLVLAHRDQLLEAWRDYFGA